MASFKKLPKNLQCLCNWYAWLEYDYKNNIESKDYYIYAYFRYWLLEEINTWQNEINIPVIKSYKEFISIWFECDKNLDKESLLNVNPRKNYQVKKTYKGIGLHLCD